MRKRSPPGWKRIADRAFMVAARGKTISPLLSVKVEVMGRPCA